MTSDRELEKCLKAVANKKRIAIVRHLKLGSSTVGEIAKAIKLSLKSTSRHLQVLLGAEFVTTERKELYIHYSLNPQTDLDSRIAKIIAP